MLGKENVSRRSTVTRLLSGVMAFHMPNLTAIAAPPTTEMRENSQRSMIVLFGEGGPASQDSFDPKVGSASTDSFFGEIETSVPDLHFTAPWERLAERAHRMTVFRAHHTDMSAVHALAVPDALQNIDDGKNTFTSLADASGKPPVFMHTPNVIQQSAGKDLRKLFLYDRGVVSDWDQRQGTFANPYSDLGDEACQTRLELLRDLNQDSPLKMEGEMIRRWEEQTELAARLLDSTSDVIGSLHENDVRRYSNDQRPTPESLILLSAREIIRSGISRLVFVRTGGIGATKFQTYGWDHHFDAQALLRLNIPVLDHTMAQLIDDTHPKKGIMPDTSIVFMTDMGRTPRIDTDSGGRDHFPWRSSVIVSNVLAPAVIGSTDAAMCGKSDIITNIDFAETLKKLM